MNSLGPYSHTGRAIADDDELQREREATLGPAASKPPRGGPRLQDWDQFDELRAVIIDAAERVAVTVAQANTAKGQARPKYRPTKRPRTAAQRAEYRRDMDVAREIVAEATPWAQL